MKLWAFVLILLLGSVAAASAINEMNVVVFPDVPSTTFTYNFVFASTNACDVLLNASASITTNLAGRGNATIDTSSLGTTVPAYLCTYRDGTLVNKQSLNRNAFESFSTSTEFSSVGNWTADKPSYAPVSYVQSAGNWTNDKIGYTLSANLVTALGNWSLDKISYTPSSGLATALGNWSLDKPNYALISYVNSAGNWTADKPNIYTNITDLQTFQTSTYTSIATGNSSAYDSVFINNIIQLNATDNPTTPPPESSLDVYAKNISGRMMLKAMGPSGNDYPYQPSFFQNLIMFIGTGGAGVINVVGTTVTSTGTTTHVASSTLGYMVNHATAASANATAGTGSNVAMVSRVTTVPNAADGWFFNARVAYPDAASLTNMRAFVGLTSGTLAASTSADDPAGQGIGFMYSTTGLGSDWTFMSDDNVGLTRQGTGLNFSINAVYDMYMYCSHNCSTVYWRIDDLTYGQTQSGNISANLPTSGTLMRFGHQIRNVDATARNVRMQRIYLEADR